MQHDTGAWTGIARHHWAQADDRRLVFHQDVAARADFQRAGAGNGEAAVKDVAAGLHHGHIVRVTMHEKIVGVLIRDRAGY
ncbi:hypothetical protein D3C71_1363110 [compost metagenome]